MVPVMSASSSSGTPPMPEAYVGLASNVDAERQLRRAVAGLEKRFGPARRSSVYSSAATGVPAPDYLNLVVAFATHFALGEVREFLAALESSAGRVRGTRAAGACQLDLDLLLYGRRVDPEARVPRGDIRRHPYVLAPLAELAPELLHPVTGEALGAAWRAQSTGVVRPLALGDLLSAEAVLRERA